MAAVYIIFSKSINKYYVGSCINFDSRLNEHNSHKYTGYTNRASDWMLFWKLELENQMTARSIELHIKKMKSSKYYYSLKAYPEISEKLIDKYSAGSSR